MKTSIYNSLKTILLIIGLSSVFHLQSQDWKEDKKINIGFGLTQPLLVSGFNIEGNYIHNRLFFDYSHGISLDFSGSSVSPDLKKQGIAVHMPYTTGFGVGYRFTKHINLRLEPKWHKLEFYYEGESQNNSNMITSYNIFSLGLGLYGYFQPFEKSNSFLKGIMIAPSIRFWPTVSSSMKEDTYTYDNKNTGSKEVIKTLNPGIGFTPLVINVTLGYTFNLRKS